MLKECHPRQQLDPIHGNEKYSHKCVFFCSLVSSFYLYVKNKSSESERGGRERERKKGKREIVGFCWQKLEEDIGLRGAGVTSSCDMPAVET